jgi:CheY-like chemotaxis protein
MPSRRQVFLETFQSSFCSIPRGGRALSIPFGARLRESQQPTESRESWIIERLGFRSIAATHQTRAPTGPRCPLRVSAWAPSGYLSREVPDSARFEILLWFWVIKRNTCMSPILVVDDSEEDLMLTERVLQQCKILNPIYLLKSGKQCLKFFEAPGSDDLPPCILFLDLVMRPMDGLDVLRALKDCPRVNQSLIVMLSGLTDIRAVQQGYRLGAHTFLVKPLTAEDMLQTVAAMRKYLETEEVPEGYIIHLVPDTSTSFIRKPGLREQPAVSTGEVCA